MASTCFYGPIHVQRRMLQDHFSSALEILVILKSTECSRRLATLDATTIFNAWKSKTLERKTRLTFHLYSEDFRSLFGSLMVGHIVCHLKRDSVF